MRLTTQRNESCLSCISQFICFFFTGIIFLDILLEYFDHKFTYLMKIFKNLKILWNLFSSEHFVPYILINLQTPDFHYFLHSWIVQNQKFTKEWSKLFVYVYVLVLYPLLFPSTGSKTQTLCSAYKSTQLILWIGCPSHQLTM